MDYQGGLERRKYYIYIFISDSALTCTHILKNVWGNIVPGGQERHWEHLEFISTHDSSWPCKLFQQSNKVRALPDSAIEWGLVGRHREGQREKDRGGGAGDASVGPCWEIKGHTLWIGNPNSHLLSCWPMGKSNAIRPEKRPLSSWSLSSKSSPRLQSIISPLHLTLHQPCVKCVHWWQCVRPHWGLRGELRRKGCN